MTEIASATARAPALLDSLAAEARLYRASIDMSMYQLARVFVQARELVPHGEWENWLRDNADVSVRTAQDMMAVYRRFGDRPAFENIGKSKLFRMLALPEGTEEGFVSEHPVGKMTIREVDEAVKRERAKAQIEIDREKAARREAEARADAAERRKPELSKLVQKELQEGREARQSADHFAELARRTAAEKAALERENRRLQAELSDQNGMLEEQQEALNAAQEALLSLQSAAARGESEHGAGTEVSIQTLAAAVREFMGSCARVPYLGPAFGAMPLAEKSEWLDLVRTVEGWCEGARRALESVCVEGAVVNG